jgi:hypothetical protein
MHKNRNASEHDFQTIAESLFEKLGWLQHKGEIITQKAIPIGSSGNFKPDIVIQTNGQRLFVVELKKPNIPISGRNGEQLFSYMRQLKLNFGVLLGETLQVYYELPNDNKPPVKINEIPFDNDSTEGIKFIKILSKNECSLEKLQEYCKDKLINIEKKEKAQKLIMELCSPKGTGIMINLLREKLSTKYSEEIVTSIIDEIDIHILRKGIKPPSPTPPGGPKKSKAKSLCKENGINLYEKITFASKNTGGPFYYANPNIKFLTHDWSLLLNDREHNKLHVLNIPANSIKNNQVRPRGDIPSKIDLQIKYEDDLFEDSRSGIQFVKWLVKTISYEKGFLNDR